jgi:maltose 6'-phosphate phosphatase
MRNLIRYLAAISVAALLLALPARPVAAGTASCAEDGTIRIMTLNLLFSEVDTREDRLDGIADYINDQGVDIVLLQEVVGGVLSRTANSALDLKTRLEDDYDLSYRMANGIPGLLTVGNAILSRCPILYTVAKTLPFVSEEIFEGIEIPLKRRTMMSRVWVPRFGKINVYNNHLCAFCSPEDRWEQAKVAYKFLLTMEALIPGSNPIVLGGDFNTQDDSALYAAITSQFVESYADANPGFTPCVDNGFIPSCTFGAFGNPYTDDPQVRIDYIFVWDLAVQGSEVVFNTPWMAGDPSSGFVSDHSAVVTDVQLPQ